MSKYLIEVGKGKGSYKVRASFNKGSQSRAILYYTSLNTHSGFKKRLVRVAEDGTRTVVDRVIT